MRGTIRARGKGRWQVQAYAGRGPDDREKRVARTIRGTKRDAERALAALVVEVEAGQHRGDDPTIATLAEQWYAARSGAWSPRTRDSYRRELDHRILPHLGQRKARTVDARDLDLLYATLAAEGAGARRHRHRHRPRRAVTQSEENGQNLADQAERSCDFYIATADALATLADSPDLTVEQLDAIRRMQQVARTCRQEKTP